MQGTKLWIRILHYFFFTLTLNVIKLNQKRNKNAMGLSLVVGGPSHYGEHVWIMKTWPLLEKKTFLINVDFMHFPKKWPISTRHKSLYFYHMKEFLYFLETSESLLTNVFGLISK